MQGTYYRWTRISDNTLEADILGIDTKIYANTETGLIAAAIPTIMDADTARMIGEHLIEAAILANNAVREY